MRVLNADESLQFFTHLLGFRPPNDGSGIQYNGHDVPRASSYGSGGTNSTKSRGGSSSNNTDRVKSRGGPRRDVNNGSICVYQDVRLTDPVLLSRLRLPCRGFDCAHVQCFDIEPFISLCTVQRGPTGALSNNFVSSCPVCGKVVDDANIYVDYVMCALLAACENHETVQSVRIHADLTVEVPTGRQYSAAAEVICVDDDVAQYAPQRSVSDSSIRSGPSRTDLATVVSSYKLPRTYTRTNKHSERQAATLPVNATNTVPNSQQTIKQARTLTLSLFSTSTLSITSFQDTLHYLNAFTNDRRAQLPISDVYSSKIQQMRPLKAGCWLELEKGLQKILDVGAFHFMAASNGDCYDAY
jgi:hypothetical protein